MEVRTTTEMLGRLRLSPLAKLLIPSLSNGGRQIPRQSTHAISFPSIQGFRAVPNSSLRSFTTSSTRYQRSSAAARPEPKDEEDPSSSPASRSSQSHSSAEVNSSFFNEVASMIDSIPKSKPAASTQRTSRFSSPNAQAQKRPGNSANDVLKNFTAHVDRERARPQTSRIPTERMQMPPSLNRGPAATPTSRFQGPPQLPSLPPLRLSPSVGRSVSVLPNRGMDVDRAFVLLNVKCAQNKVKSEFIRQKFHERPGLKRKRLRSQRWRIKFIKGFKKMVYKVQDMKRQGW